MLAVFSYGMVCAATLISIGVTLHVMIVKSKETARRRRYDEKWKAVELVRAQKQKDFRAGQQKEGQDSPK